MALANAPAFLRPANIISPASAFATIALSTTPQQVDLIPFCQVVSFGATANFGVTYGSSSAVFPAASTTIGATQSSSAAVAEINPTSRNLQSTSATTGLCVIGTTAGGFLSIAMYSRGG